MKPDDIEDLLTRYYEGVTSEAEEKELKRFFMEEEVSEDLLAEKECICTSLLLRRIRALLPKKPICRHKRRWLCCLHG